MSLLREPIAFHSFRHSPMNPRTKGGVENDLLIHDVDIALRVFSEKPSGITGMRFSLKGGADAINSEISEALLRFSRGRIAHCSSSLRSHRKIRTISIAEPDRLIELDLIRQDITIYRHIEESASIDDLGYQQQTIIEIPLIQFTGEPLMLQWDQFTRILLEDVDDGVSPESLLLPHQVIHRLSESDCQ